MIIEGKKKIRKNMKYQMPPHGTKYEEFNGLSVRTLSIWFANEIV